MNSNDSLCDIEVMIATAKAFQQKEKNKALIAEYRALAKEQGKVWGELNEEEITKMIIDHEFNKKAALMAQEEALPCSAALKAAKEQAPTQAQVPVSIQPPTWFDLSYGDATEVISHISSLTDRFNSLEQDYAYELTQRIIHRPFTTFGYLPAPPNADICKQVIGKDGYFFKLTTTNTNVDFIWHDRGGNNFLFWGEKANVIQAMKIIRSRIIKRF